MRRALLLAALVLVPAAPAAAEEGVPETGWWSRSRVGAPSPVEAPLPFVPPGGTWVSGNGNGVLALAALRLELPDDAQAAELALEAADVRGTPRVQVCAAGVRWTPNADGRRFDEAPVPDCTAFEALGELVDGALVVPLAAAPAGTVDVVLLPAPGAAFSLTLRPATASSVAVTAPGEPLPPADPAAPGGPAGDTGGGTGASDLPPLTSSSGALPGLDAGSGSASVPLLPGTAPLPPETALEVAPPQAAAPLGGTLPTRPAALPVEDRRTALVAAALLAALGALAVRLAGTPVPAPAALGGAARLRGGAPRPAPASAPRGVGRFRSERTGRPPAV
ncbi:MAG TPA: hypothetical protein VNU66_04970 [Mycobacteriales bacterium]|nr:hypothetical protein [Mycobacteriales bacterium]